jgi:autotransporter adhesin
VTYAAHFFRNYIFGKVMNHVYRIVRNAATEGWAVTSELVKGRSKGSQKAPRASAKSMLSMGGVMLATALGSVAFAPSAIAGSIINCGAGSSSYASFTSPATGEPGPWGQNNPGTCSTAGTTGVVLSEDGNYYSPNGKAAAILVGSSGSNGAGMVGIYGPNGITMTGTTITTGLAMFQSGADMSNTKITSLAAGTLSAASTDAVNGSQLFATNTNVSNLQNTVNNITNGTAGLVQQVSA